MISGFTTADNGAVIYCNDAVNPTVFSNNNITIGVGPFNLTKTSSSSGVNRISLSWDCVGSGCRPSEYLVKWSETGMTEKQMSTSNMAYTITGLNGCTSYSVTVEGEHRCGTSNFINVIQTMEGVPGPVPDDSEVNLRSFNESFGNLELLINTPIPRDDVCDGTTINIEITVNSDGAPFSDTVEYMRSGQVYPTNIYLPVGSNFTAEICAVTSVGRGQCIMYKKASSPSTTTESDSVLTTGAAVGISVAVCVFIMILLTIASFFLGYLFGEKRASSNNRQESGESKSASTVTNKQGGACYEAIEVEQKVSLETNPAYGVLK